MRIKLGFKGSGRDTPPGRAIGKRTCEYRKENGTIKVNCRGCSQPAGLDNPPCFKGVLKILANESGGREVLLSRDWEIVYDQECIASLAGLAEVIRFCNGLAFAQPFEECSSCPSNPRAIVSRVVDRLPQSGPELGPSGVFRSGGHGLACEQCIRTTRSNLEHVSALLEETERMVTRMAFKVVPTDEHA